MLQVSAHTHTHLHMHPDAAAAAALMFSQQHPGFPGRGAVSPRRPRCCLSNCPPCSPRPARIQAAARTLRPRPGTAATCAAPRPWRGLSAEADDPARPPRPRRSPEAAAVRARARAARGSRRRQPRGLSTTPTLATRGIFEVSVKLLNYVSVVRRNLIFFFPDKPEIEN